MQRNGWLIAAIVLGASYWLVAGQEHGPLLVAWKGSGAALLAVAAGLVAHRHPAVRRDAALLATVMALGALGDIGIEFSLTVGAAFFLIGHAIAIGLYLINRCARSTADIGLAAAILLLIPSVAWNLPADRAIAPVVMVYASGLALMTGTAWLSGFPRHRVALGALMFAASDLLIFARMGPLAGSIIPRLLVWPLYFGGQALICTGVLGALSRRPAT